MFINVKITEYKKRKQMCYMMYYNYRFRVR